ncbi:MAG: hypothetical protein ACYTF6_04250 [Planctomycetota bacterium]|jgi:hypothetical protein
MIHIPAEALDLLLLGQQAYHGTEHGYVFGRAELVAVRKWRVKLCLVRPILYGSEQVHGIAHGTTLY